MFLLTILGIYLSFKLAVFYIPFLIAFIISLLVEPLIRLLTNKSNLPRKTCAIMVLTIVSIILVGTIAVVIITLITESSNLLQGLNGYIEKLSIKFQELVRNIEFTKINIPTEISDIINNSSHDFLQIISTWVKNTLSTILQGITELPQIFIYIGITLISTYFICTDKLYILDQMEHHLPKTWLKRLMIKVKKVISSLGCYLKAQFILVGISFVITIISLYILKWIGMNVQYPFLVAIAIGFVDALPILGSGTIIIPWAVIVALDGDIKLAIALLVLLATISIVRQFIEPKVISKQIGIHPIFTLIAMFTGFKIIGILGLLLGPIALIILKNVFETLIDRGLVKSIFDRK